jgi:hypothetical protein
MELTAEGLRAHLAEPTDTATAHGRKRRAKTDKGDACWKRELLIAGKLPESWIPGGEPLLQQSCLPYEWLSATFCEPRPGRLGLARRRPLAGVDLLS